MNFSPRYRSGCLACEKKRQQCSVIEYKRPNITIAKPKLTMATKIPKIPNSYKNTKQCNYYKDSFIPIPTRMLNNTSEKSKCQVVDSIIVERQKELEESNSIVVETLIQPAESDLIVELQEELEELNSIAVEPLIQPAESDLIVELQEELEELNSIAVEPLIQPAEVLPQPPKRLYRQKNLEIYKDVEQLQHLLNATFDQLLNLYNELQNPKSKHILLIKQGYIAKARDIYDLSVNIVYSWTPVATQCLDSSLSNDLSLDLSKVQLLAAQLRLLTNQKELDQSDTDEAGSLISCSGNVMQSTKRALNGLQAAKLCLYLPIT
jgi:hypothetical protein